MEDAILNFEQALGEEDVYNTARPSCSNSADLFFHLHSTAISTTHDSLSFLPTSSLTYDIVWEVPQYLAQKCCAGTSLGQVFTITGDVSDAQGMSVERYIRKTWGSVGLLLLNELEAWLGLKQQEVKEPNVMFTMAIEDSYNGTGSISFAKLRFVASSEIHQQLVAVLSWLCAAVRHAKIDEGGKISASRAITFWDEDNSIRFRLVDLEIETRKSCWNPLFQGVVIAINNKSTHARPADARGLEISYDDLMQFAGASGCGEWIAVMSESLTSSDNVIYFVKTLDDNCIQLHLGNTGSLGQKNNCLEYNVSASAAKASADNDRTSFPSEDLAKFLKTKRLFLGWAAEAEHNIGSSVEMACAVKTSGAYNSPSYRFIKSISLNFAGRSAAFPIGMSFAAARRSAPTSYSLFSENSAPLEQRIGSAKDLAAMIVDTDQGTTVLVSLTRVLLFIAQVFIATDPNSEDSDLEKVAKIKYTLIPPSSDGADEAREKIIKLIEEDTHEPASTKERWNPKGNPKKVRWRAIFHYIAHDLQNALNPFLAMYTTHLRKAPGKVFGMELMSFAKFENSGAFREAKVNSAWAHIPFEEPMLVLFCRNMGEMVSATNKDGLCKKWYTVPSGQNYLVSCGATVYRQMALHIDNDKTRLAKRIKWETTPYKPLITSHTLNTESRCDHVQQLSSQGIIGVKGQEYLFEALEKYQECGFIFGNYCPTVTIPKMIKYKSQSRRQKPLQEKILVPLDTPDKSDISTSPDFSALFDISQSKADRQLRLPINPLAPGAALQFVKGESSRHEDGEEWRRTYLGNKAERVRRTMEDAAYRQQRLRMNGDDAEAKLEERKRIGNIRAGIYQPPTPPEAPEPPEPPIPRERLTAEEVRRRRLMRFNERRK
ncbi:hypothetical protein B7494_g4237 [Chlorociboria aeruginascens]|nr:hypothetical protein B7494_g4237 [Chlorociboria aeruginascens]